MGKHVISDDGASNIPSTVGTLRSTNGFTHYVRDSVDSSNLNVMQSTGDDLNIGLADMDDINIRVDENMRVYVDTDLRIHADATGIGVFNTPPASQQADIGALTDSSGGTPSATIGAVAGSGADAAINNNFASLTTQMNAVRALLRAYGWMA